MKTDNVNHPSHYADHCSIECFDAMKAILGYEGIVYFCFGNMFKYLWRHKFKNGAEDIKKATWYSAKAVECISEIEDTDFITAGRLSDIGNPLMDILEKADKEYPPEEDKDLDDGLDEMLEKLANDYDKEKKKTVNYVPYWDSKGNYHSDVVIKKEEKNNAKDESPSKAEEVLDNIGDYITRYDGDLSDSAKIAHIHGLLATYYYGKCFGSDS